MQVFLSSPPNGLAPVGAPKADVAAGAPPKSEGFGAAAAEPNNPPLVLVAKNWRGQRFCIQNAPPKVLVATGAPNADGAAAVPNSEGFGAVEPNRLPPVFVAESDMIKQRY